MCLPAMVPLADVCDRLSEVIDREHLGDGDVIELVDAAFAGSAEPHALAGHRGSGPGRTVRVLARGDHLGGRVPSW